MPNPPGTLFTPRFDRFFRSHERVMWQFGALRFDEIQPHLVTDTDIDAIRAAMLVESHHPVYEQYLLEYFRHDHEMTSFIVTWSYEEMKHYAALRTYLEALDVVDSEDLGQELARTRSGEWGEEWHQEEQRFTLVQSYTYTMLQEQVTGLFYKRFAGVAQEPVLKELLLLIGKDEYRHCQYYLEKGQEALSQDRHLMEEVDDVLLHFQMPGPTFVENYPQHREAMLKVANLDLAALKESLDKISQLTGKLHIVRMATNSAFLRKLRDEWGIDPKLVLSAMRYGANPTA